jgi:hypothetical protein
MGYYSSLSLASELELSSLSSPYDTITSSWSLSSLGFLEAYAFSSWLSYCSTFSSSPSFNEALLDGTLTEL